MDSLSSRKYELISKAQGGDIEAKNKLVKEHLYLVRNTVKNYYIDGGETEDLVQEGSIAFCNAVDSYDESKNCKFESFAKLCIKRKAISVIKAYSRKKNKPLLNYYSLNQSFYDSDNQNIDILENKKAFDPLDIVLEKEENELVSYIIKNKLSKFERSVTILRMQGYSYLEIAEMLEVTEKSVDNALQRAKNKINKQLKNYKY